MSISDIKNELDTIKNKTKNISESNKKNIDDILQNNIESMEKYVNNKVINIYSRPWTKLESRLKKKKVNEYLQLLLTNNTISLKEFNTILYKSNKDLEKTSQSDVNKKIKIEYDIDSCEITNFYYLCYLQH